MKKFKIHNQSIHDDNFFTFETTWMGKEIFDFENKNVLLPMLNLDVENTAVKNYTGVSQESLYIEKSYFLFKGVYQLEKNIAIHSKDRKSFIVKNFKEIIKIETLRENINFFELGGMGIFQNYTYDGVFKIHCEECYFVLPENYKFRKEFKSMNDYNPFEEDWLNNMDLR